PPAGAGRVPGRPDEAAAVGGAVMFPELGVDDARVGRILSTLSRSVDRSDAETVVANRHRASRQPVHRGLAGSRPVDEPAGGGREVRAPPPGRRLELARSRRSPARRLPRTPRAVYEGGLDQPPRTPARPPRSPDRSRTRRDGSRDAPGGPPPVPRRLLPARLPPRDAGERHGRRGAGRPEGPPRVPPDLVPGDDPLAGRPSPHDGRAGGRHPRRVLGARRDLA